MPDPQQQNRNRTNNSNRTDSEADSTTADAGRQATVRPGAPGGGALSSTYFSGDHVLENIAAGNGTLRKGAKGPAVRALQQYLIAAGFELGRSGADGDYGNRTVGAVRSWQRANGLGSDGVVGKNTLGKMDKVDPGSSDAPSPNTQKPGANEPGGGLPGDFEAMWEAHPHNYQDDESQNYDSGKLQEDQGWDPNQYSNTCAIRLSVMFNELGGNHLLTRKKAKQAGIRPERLPYSRKTGWYYILSAKEMWQYCEYWCGAADVEYPSRGRFSNATEFNQKFDEEIREEISGKKGIVAFCKIFTYSGTGHVDIFNGEKLSDASDWYPSHSLKIWYV